MIKEIQISNFLSHKNSILKLSPGVNIIVGLTDAGKSAIIRALRWVILNRPVGDGVRSNWGGITAVSIHTDEAVITRIKDKKRNLYKIDHAEFKAIRTDVPEEVLEVLNIDESNIHSQFDSHFLISKSPGEVAKHWNKIAHLEKIDLGIKNCNKAIKTTTSTIEHYKTDVKEFQDNLTSYEVIDEIEAELLSIQAYEEKATELDIELLKAERIRDELNDINTTQRNYTLASNAEEDVRMLLGYHQTKDKLIKDLVEVNEDINAVRVIRKQIKHNSEVLELEKPVNELLELKEDYHELAMRTEEAEETHRYASLIMKDIKSNQLLLNVLEDDWHAKGGETCPVCGNEIGGYEWEDNGKN